MNVRSSTGGFRGRNAARRPMVSTGVSKFNGGRRSLGLLQETARPLSPNCLGTGQPTFARIDYGYSFNLLPKFRERPIRNRRRCFFSARPELEHDTTRV